MAKYICPICGKHELEDYDECPWCHWVVDGTEGFYPEDAPVSGPMGSITVKQAKERLAQGRDAYGELLGDN